MHADPCSAHNPSASRAPAFVVMSAPKSGSTWTQLMLCAHPEAHCVELRPWGRSYRPFADDRYHVNLDHYAGFLSKLLWLPSPDPERDADALAEALHGTALGWVSGRTGKRVVGEKATPYEGGSALAVERYAAEDPGLAFVHLVRDPRDVVVSGFVHHTRAHPPTDSRVRERYAECLELGRVPDEAIGRWVGNWRDVVDAAALAEARFARFLEVRYEDLVADPAGVFGGVLAHLGLACDERTVDACVEAGSFERMSGRAPGDEDRGSFFRKGVAGDWANWLTPEQAERVADAAGPGFARLYGAGAAAP